MSATGRPFPADRRRSDRLDYRGNRLARQGLCCLKCIPWRALALDEMLGETRMLESLESGLAIVAATMLNSY